MAATASAIQGTIEFPWIIRIPPTKRLSVKIPTKKKITLSSLRDFREIKAPLLQSGGSRPENLQRTIILVLALNVFQHSIDGGSDLVSLPDLAEASVRGRNSDPSFVPREMGDLRDRISSVLAATDSLAWRSPSLLEGTSSKIRTLWQTLVDRHAPVSAAVVPAPSAFQTVVPPLAAAAFAGSGFGVGPLSPQPPAPVPEATVPIEAPAAPVPQEAVAVAVAAPVEAKKRSSDGWLWGVATTAFKIVPGFVPIVGPVWTGGVAVYEAYQLYAEAKDQPTWVRLKKVGFSVLVKGALSFTGAKVLGPLLSKYFASGSAYTATRLAEVLRKLGQEELDFLLKDFFKEVPANTVFNYISIQGALQGKEAVPAAFVDWVNKQVVIASAEIVRNGTIAIGAAATKLGEEEDPRPVS
jgi:hypothetical protein